MTHLAGGEENVSSLLHDSLHGDMERIMRKKSKRCLVCRASFSPDPRVGDRQRACSPECQKERHRRQCRRWNQRHRRLRREHRLDRRLQEILDQGLAGERKGSKVGRLKGEAGEILATPLAVVQDKIDSQVLAVMLFMLENLVTGLVRRDKGRKALFPGGYG